MADSSSMTAGLQEPSIISLKPYFSFSSASARTLFLVNWMNFWPANPGLTVMTMT